MKTKKEKLKKIIQLSGELKSLLNSLSFSDKQYIDSQIADDSSESFQAAKEAAGDLLADLTSCEKCGSENVKNKVLESKDEPGKADFEVVNFHCADCFSSWSEF